MAVPEVGGEFEDDDSPEFALAAGEFTGALGAGGFVVGEAAAGVAPLNGGFDGGVFAGGAAVAVGAEDGAIAVVPGWTAPGDSII